MQQNRWKFRKKFELFSGFNGHWVGWTVDLGKCMLSNRIETLRIVQRHEQYRKSKKERERGIETYL